MNKFFLLVLFFLGLFIQPVNANDQETKTKHESITFKKPPEALGKWYKPANKRQVWLHTMFRLRREILAMNDYAEKGQQEELEKWMKKFSEDYQSIAKMVPQWQEYLYLDKLQELQTSVDNQNYTSISGNLKKMGKSCMHCHDDFQTVATLIYRSADFNQQTVKLSTLNQAIGFDDMMGQLSNSINRINIAIQDEYFSNALMTLPSLKQQLKDLSTTCSTCHQKDNKPLKRIMDASDELLPELAVKLNQKEKKQAGRTLGEFAVKVCARCHAVHRIVSDLKSQFE